MIFSQWYTFADQYIFRFLPAHFQLCFLLQLISDCTTAVQFILNYLMRRNVMEIIFRIWFDNFKAITISYVMDTNGFIIIIYRSANEFECLEKFNSCLICAVNAKAIKMNRCNYLSIQMHVSGCNQWHLMLFSFHYHGIINYSFQNVSAHSALSRTESCKQQRNTQLFISNFTLHWKWVNAVECSW